MEMEAILRVTSCSLGGSYSEKDTPRALGQLEGSTSHVHEVRVSAPGCSRPGPPGGQGEPACASGGLPPVIPFSLVPLSGKTLYSQVPEPKQFGFNYLL